MMRILFAYLWLLLLVSCGSTRFVPMPVMHSEKSGHNTLVFETGLTTELRTDREHSKENVTVTVNEAGDTVRTDREFILVHDRSLERENTRLRAVIDSLNEARTDSVPYPVEVPARLTRWQQLKVDYGGWAALALLLVGVAVIKLRSKFRTR